MFQGIVLAPSWLEFLSFSQIRVKIDYRNALNDLYIANRSRKMPNFDMDLVLVYVECRKKSSRPLDEVVVTLYSNLVRSLLKPRFFLKDDLVSKQRTSQLLWNLLKILPQPLAVIWGHRAKFYVFQTLFVYFGIKKISNPMFKVKP